MDFKTDANEWNESFREGIIKEFNDTAVVFLMKLRNVFKRYSLKFENAANEILVANESPEHMIEPLLRFYDSVHEHINQIADHDEGYFLNEGKNLSILQGVDIENLWQKVPKGTKNAIWQYMEKLVSFAVQYNTLGNATQQISQLDPNMMQDLMKNAMESIDDYMAANNNQMPATQEELMNIARNVQKKTSQK
jgi:hypothetical protein